MTKMEIEKIYGYNWEITAYCRGQYFGFLTEAEAIIHAKNNIYQDDEPTYRYKLFTKKPGEIIHYAHNE